VGWRDSKTMRRRRPLVEDAATQRGRLNSDKAGEFHFSDTADYLKFTSRALQQSSLKTSKIAEAGGMSPTTASNMAKGKTRYPRFSTITGILGALGYETLIRGGKK
jgi:transcriptional regulator with XRE-family HTH domain